jgi:alkanesulfonate monooxygenase SsuD/methylene tetrahydromethanopterin reductase-like flavin-dependent oxidoreductase (luciferase family)
VSLQFGIFGHVDDNGTRLADLFETRLKLVEQYDRSGFRSYHIAEHHSTPLGMAPSPTDFWQRWRSGASACVSARCSMSHPCTMRFASPKKW